AERPAATACFRDTTPSCFLSSKVSASGSPPAMGECCHPPLTFRARGPGRLATRPRPGGVGLALHRPELGHADENMTARGVPGLQAAQQDADPVPPAGAGPGAGATAGAAGTPQ